MKLSPRQRRKFKKALCEGARVLYREPPLTGVEWADAHYYMSPESSYIEGPWKTAPSQIAILNSMCNDDIREVNWLKSARVGYTKLICAAIAYFIEHKKRNVGVWQPDDGARDGFSKKHIDPMLRDVDPLRAIFPYLNKKSKQNTIENKAFVNRRELFLMGGKAAKNYREKSLDVSIYDELSKFDRDVEGEGSPTFLGDKRLEGSAFGKSIRGSSPTVKGECQITEAADESEQEFRRHIPCCKCGAHQELIFGGKDASHGLEWNKELEGSERARSARYRCVSCDDTFTYADFIEADKQGYWLSNNGLATIDGITYYHRDDFPEKKRIAPTPESVTWILNSLYSNFSPWSRIITDWYKAQGNPMKLKSFINTTLGEAFEELERVKTEPEHLLARREHYNAEVPDRVGFITVGGDMQDHWAEFTVKGWAAGEESFVIDQFEVHGDPSTPDFWDMLEKPLRKSYTKANGQVMNWATGVFDSGGHYTDEVYKFTKRFGVMRLFPGKGASEYGKPIATKPKKKNSHGVYLVMVGTDNAKDMIYDRVCIVPSDPTVPHPGSMHFPMKEWCDISFFNQLLAEVKKPLIVKGQKTYRWVNPPGKRNEKLDCEVYNLAALRIAQQYFGLNLDTLIPQYEESASKSPSISDIGRLLNGNS
ncbi:phage terminase large subunit family protein [Alteromonas pelagimontana]|uniref:Phage terminase large subunit family protein n=1 Tax=Alteromonas pelagimontana TaxID=1858656 RepID=A0A6M4M8U3_9ALTE|nr:terminase gpA endonuclease subunit [Alteromonas pelagimontana]QJR79614.1 phage terminase large subunit family protein [Alteromonas pelagimontana]